MIAVQFESYKKSVVEALDAIKADTRLSAQAKILIKPNLVNASPHPVTTSSECCAVIIDYIRNCSDAKIVIAEGCGAAGMETADVFQTLGYDALAQDRGVELVDLNHAPLKKVKNDKCVVFPEMYLPEMAFTHYIISVPVLKAHSLAVVTGSLKNMMGFLPPRHYSGRFGTWKKAVFHEHMQQSIIDLNRYIWPDLTLMDASVGLSEYHLGGPQCNPPVRKVMAGYNPWEVDREAARLLGVDWKEVPHLRMDLQKGK